MSDSGIWDEEAIRQELERLDKITGLHGSSLPITFGKARYQLGSFHVNPQKKEPKKFHFSLFYYGNPEWSKESALDTIRHEYAHYMDYMLYGNGGHGPTWKMCCRKIGANPSRCYSEKMEAIYRKKEERQKEISVQVERFQPGKKIKHPKFGIGVIRTIKGPAERRILEVEFPQHDIRRLGAAWVNENCKLIPE